MLIDMDQYFIGVIIVILIGIVLGMRRILALEEKITYLLSIVKNKEDNIDKKVSFSSKNKIQKKKKIISKSKKK